MHVHWAAYAKAMCFDHPGVRFVGRDRRLPLRNATARISEFDAKELNLKEGNYIALENEHGRFVGPVRIMDMAEGFLQTYWPESNVLIPPECLV